MLARYSYKRPNKITKMEFTQQQQNDQYQLTPNDSEGNGSALSSQLLCFYQQFPSKFKKLFSKINVKGIAIRYNYTAFVSLRF
jgi:hypothetical protein